MQWILYGQHVLFWPSDSDTYDKNITIERPFRGSKKIKNISMDRQRSLRRRHNQLPQPPFAERAKDHCRQFTAFMFSNVGIIILVVVYMIGGKWQKKTIIFILQWTTVPYIPFFLANFLLFLPNERIYIFGTVIKHMRYKF